MDAKAEILARIGQAGVRSLSAERVPLSNSDRTRAEIVEQFAAYAAEYKANVVRVSASGLGKAIEGLLRGRVLVPSDLPLDWLLPGQRLEVVPDEGLSLAELDAADAVLTGCAVAIAETGTVVLDHGVGQGRRALTLVPDHHVVIVPAARIVDSVAEAVTALAGAVGAGQPLTWISGPSATSDIELSRVEGVHGPRRLDLLVVDD